MNRLTLVAALLLLVAALPTMAIEEPPYSVVQRHEDFEVRRYEPYLVAQTVIQADAEAAGNRGFRALAAYIFGANKGARRIAMTAPVAQAPLRIAMTAPVAQSGGGDGRQVVQFMMPREWTRDTLPEPEDPAVVIAEMPARTLAVIAYSGTWSRERYEQHLATLREGLARAGLRERGEPVWARYDPPWKPWFLRRNEIWIEVD
jgi:hypothetical protein